MPRKRSKSPKHRSRSKSRAKSKAKSRSKSKNRKYGGSIVVDFEYALANSEIQEDKYGISIIKQEWTKMEDGKQKYFHKGRAVEQNFFSKNIMPNLFPNYIERLPLTNEEGKQNGPYIIAEWREGDKENFTFRSTNLIPQPDVITSDCPKIGNYFIDKPCKIIYSPDKNGDFKIFLKVYYIKNKNCFNGYFMDTKGPADTDFVANSKEEMLTITNEITNNLIIYLKEKRKI